MNRRLIVRASLLSLVLIVQVGCGGQSPASITPGPTTEVPTTAAPPTEPSTEPTTETPTEPPVTEAPATLIAPVLKPSLVISGLQGTPTGPDSPYGHTVAFTTPNGEILIKAAGMVNPVLDKDGVFTSIGYVEVGPNAVKIDSGVYQVGLDLTNKDAEVVSATLVPQSGAGKLRTLTFARTPTERNENREKDPTVPPINPLIRNNATCFVIGFVEGKIAPSGTDPQSWSVYCSQASTDEAAGDAILSVRDIFPDAYAKLQGELKNSQGHVIDFLQSKGYSLEQITPDFDSIISEIEGHPNIESCNIEQQCQSDLTGAPNSSFWSQYDEAKSKAEDDTFTVTIALARIERPLVIPEQNINIPSGDYLVRFTFDKADETLRGAALLGVTDTNELVAGAPVPATEQYFGDQKAPRPPEMESAISAWKVGRWCICQRRC